MASKLTRIERDLTELDELAAKQEERRREEERSAV